GHERPPDREHLSLPATQRDRALLLSFSEHGEEVVDFLRPPPDFAHVAFQVRPHLQILAHAKVRKRVVDLGNVLDAQGRFLLWPSPAPPGFPSKRIFPSCMTSTRST